MFNPPCEVPCELEQWMRTQSQSALCGDMLRVIARTGGLTATQLATMYELKRRYDLRYPY